MAFTYDLMIVNGMVIDPSQSLHADTRVAIKDGLVVAIGPNLDPNEACAVYDAAGKIVTPGLINIHTHFASAVWPKAFVGGVDVDDLAKPRGYTTVVSAGDAGWAKAEKFKASSFATYDTRTYAFMYVARDGMAGKWPDNTISSSECDGNSLDVCTAGRIMATNADFFLGVKTRMSDFIIDPLGLLPLTQAIAMTDKAHDYNGRAYKVMVHVGALDTTTTIDTIVNLLRPGDVIIAHLFGVAQQERCADRLCPGRGLQAIGGAGCGEGDCPRSRRQHRTDAGRSDVRSAVLRGMRQDRRVPDDDLGR
jgi:dihydroorotase